MQICKLFHLDFQKITLKKDVAIPDDFEYYTEAENEVISEQTKEKIISLSPNKVTDFSELKPKVVAYTTTAGRNEVEKIGV